MMGEARRRRDARLRDLRGNNLARVVSPPVAAEMLGCGLTRLYELMNKGELQSYLDGGKSRRITVTSIDAYIARRLAEHEAGWRPARGPGRKKKPLDEAEAR